MKKTIILLGLALGVTHFASAQKGSVLLFGNIGYDETSAHNDPSTSNTGSEKSNQFSVSPGIGYQFSDHWAAGITLSYYHQGIPRRVRQAPTKPTWIRTASAPFSGTTIR